MLFLAIIPELSDIFTSWFYTGLGHQSSHWTKIWKNRLRNYLFYNRPWQNLLCVFFYKCISKGHFFWEIHFICIPNGYSSAKYYKNRCSRVNNNTNFIFNFHQYGQIPNLIKISHRVWATALQRVQANVIKKKNHFFGLGGPRNGTIHKISTSIFRSITFLPLLYSEKVKTNYKSSGSQK